MKKSWLRFLSSAFALKVILTLALSIQANPRPLKDLAQTAATAYRIECIASQEKLFREIKASEEPDYELYCKVLPALAITGNFPILSDNYSMLSRALQFFGQTDGFLSTMRSFFLQLYYPDTAKGPLYEIEHGLAIASKESSLLLEPETVLSFNSVVQMSESLAREFDIMTNMRWIECKNITWEIMPPEEYGWRAEKLKQQLFDQKKIVARYNARYGTNISYELHSKRPITYEWQEWLARHDITFYVG